MEKIDKAKLFLSEARAELKKVTWPTRQQATASTWVVIVVAFLMATYLGTVDLLLGWVVRHALN
ncbi:MAG: preprotein translocase subunit SecE [Thermodesulfobacteriota bacterium]